MKQRAGERIKLTSYNDLLGVSDDNMTEEIEIEKIRPFKDHPFKVQMDSKMQDLIDSIRENGVLTPVLVRPVGLDGYEMISGHRRMFAAKECGLKVLKAVVQEMNDEEATVAMVDANIQREELLPSEKAFAYKMKLEAIKRQGKNHYKSSAQNERRLDNSAQNERNPESADLLGQEVGESRAQVRRYIRLTELIPELLDLVDAKRFPFMAAVEASYIDKTVQHWLNEYIHECGIVNQKQVNELRKVVEEREITQEYMIFILDGFQKDKPSTKKVTLKGEKLERYFPKGYSVAQMENVIVQLLEDWKKGQEG